MMSRMRWVVFVWIQISLRRREGTTNEGLSWKNQASLALSWQTANNWWRILENLLTRVFLKNVEWLLQMLFYRLNCCVNLPWERIDKLYKSNKFESILCPFPFVLFSHWKYYQLFLCISGIQLKKLFTTTEYEKYLSVNNLNVVSRTKYAEVISYRSNI